MEQNKVSLYEVRWIRWVAALHHALIHQEALYCHGRKSLSTRLCGTNSTQICLFPKYSRGIWGIVPWLMCSWSSYWGQIQRPHYLSRVDHERKIRSRRQRMDIGKYSFVNSTIQHWNQLLAEVLGILPCKPITFKKRVRKVIIELN